MNLATAVPSIPAPPSGETPVCAVFGQCGGCRYQDIAYDEELAVKQESIRKLLIEGLNLPSGILEPITGSPELYGYRNNLDITFIRTRRDGKKLLGFMKERSSVHIVTVDACPIARPEISGFLPALREAAAEKLPADQRLANLKIRVGGDGRVRWGGIGRGSIHLDPAEYLWAQFGGKKIYYSLDTFFQSNLSILPRVADRMGQWATWDPRRTFFYDLYAGVGLFGFLLADRAKRVVMIESAGPAMDCARHTRDTDLYMNVDIREGRTEEEFPRLLAEGIPEEAIALVDPPRRGLSPLALESIASVEGLGALFYLSCGPEALYRDLKNFTKRGWSVEKIAAFDFFPRTKHIETLVLLKKRK